MPIWFEITALMLVAYGTGLTLGWILWGRGQPVDIGPDAKNGTDTDEDRL